MPSAVIAEDEALLSEELCQALAALWPQLEVVAQARDGIAAMVAVRELRPDVLFLDINMPDLTGLEVAKVVQGQTAVVFLTAYNEHALAAFDLGAVDYLVKPLNRARLMQAIERLKGGLGRAPAPLPESVWQAMAAPERKYLKWIQASVGNLVRLVTVEEIFFFQSDAKYTRVVTAKTEAFIRKPIKELVDELDPEVFVQVNRGAIVNLHRVESLLRVDGMMELRLKGRSETLSVSTGYQAAFRQL